MIWYDNLIYIIDKNKNARYEHDRGAYRTTPDTAAIFATYPSPHLTYPVSFTFGLRQLYLRDSKLALLTFACWTSPHLTYTVRFVLVQGDCLCLMFNHQMMLLHLCLLLTLSSGRNCRPTYWNGASPSLNMCNHGSEEYAGQSIY